jgi:hypothetical protein
VGEPSKAICSNFDRRLETAGGASKSMSACFGDAITPKVSARRVHAEPRGPSFYHAASEALNTPEQVCAVPAKKPRPSRIYRNSTLIWRDRFWVALGNNTNQKIKKGNIYIHGYLSLYGQLEHLLNNYIDSTSMDLHAKKLSRHENNQINPDNPRTKPPKHVKNTLCPQQDLQVVTHPSNLIHIPLNNSISTWTPSPVLGC